MSDSTIDAVIDRLSEHARVQDRPFAIVLHGGEPLLAGLDPMKRLLTGLRAQLPEYMPISIQTNGSLLDAAFLDLFAATRTSVSVSIDGNRSSNDRSRLDHAGKSTFDATVRGIRLLQQHADSEFLFAGVLGVVWPDTDPVTTYEFLKGLGVPSMSFLLQDGNNDRLPPGKESFKSTEYGAWLCSLFDQYIRDPNPVPLAVVDDVMRLILGGTSSQEGAGSECFGILIVDTDGTVTKNDTLKSTFNGADRFSKDWSVHSHTLKAVLDDAEVRTYQRLQVPTAAACQNCPELRVCGGGMPLYRWSKAQGLNNPSVYCHDHLLLIRHVRDTLRGMRP